MIRSVGRLLKPCTVFVMLACLLLSARPASAFVRLPSNEQMRVRIVGTKNFGGETLFEKELETRVNTTAGDALGEVAEIGMSGDYIESIAGIRGSQKVYWFYYINGLMAKVFAHGYQLRPGDVEAWDYHDWTFYSMGPSAYLGAFPEPCLHGYGGKVAPTVVVYAPGFEKEAGMLKERLTALGVAGVTVKDQDSLTGDEQQHDNIFIIATADQPLIASINEQSKAHDTLYFSGNRIVARDLTGKDSKTFGAGYGVLSVMQNPWNPMGSWACENAVWAVTGLDAAGVRRAARVLIGFPDELNHVFALVVGEGEVIKSPIGQGGSPTLALNTETDPTQADIERGLRVTALPVVAPGNSGMSEQAAAFSAWCARYWWAAVLAAAAAIIAWRLIRRRLDRKKDQPVGEQELI